jgi:NAD(P)H-hydrate epimerase
VKVLTAEEMREVDRRAIEEVGIPGAVLMENAGRKAAEFIREAYPSVRRVAVIAGKGNNGGDGFVIARYLLNWGCQVEVLLLGRKDEVRGDAALNLKVLSSMMEIVEVTDSAKWGRLKGALVFSDIIVDAMLGTGAKGAPRDLYAEVIEFINSLRVPIAAVDIPSGLDADSGLMEGVCVKAETTITMGAPKVGLLLYPGAKNVGTLRAVDLGVPDRLLNDDKFKINLVSEPTVREFLPVREDDAHKGSCGRVLVISGSVGLTGAAAMTSLAALRAGAGLVTLGVPKSLSDLMEAKLTEVMKLPLAETEGRSLAERAFDEIVGFIKPAKYILAIGPGLSRNPETAGLVKRVVSDIDSPMVIDADGLNNLGPNTDALKKRTSPTIITPHWGEMARLLDTTIEGIEKDQVGTARRATAHFRAVVVLKSARTLVADPEGNVYINPTGNSGMATAGSGDVLTGIIAGLMAQGASPVEAAVAGVYVHGMAGDLGAEVKGKMGLIAGDILESVPEALKRLSEIRPVIDGELR